MLLNPTTCSVKTLVRPTYLRTVPKDWYDQLEELVKKSE